MSDQPADTDADGATSKYTRLTITDKARILLLDQEGRTQREIADEIGCAQSSISATLKAFKGREDEIVRILLAGNIEQRIAHWDKAEEEASKRGDHRPTKDRLEMAVPKLKPPPPTKDTGGPRTIVNIGFLQPAGSQPAISITDGSMAGNTGTMAGNMASPARVSVSKDLCLPVPEGPGEGRK